MKLFDNKVKKLSSEIDKIEDNLATLETTLNSLTETANNNGIDSLASLANWLPEVFRERDEMRLKLFNALQYLDGNLGLKDNETVLIDTLLILRK